MGYTHYWKFKKNNCTMPTLEKALQKAVDDIGLVARYWNTKLHPKNSETSWMRLSGYTAHVKPGQGYRGVKLNGKGSESHEDFCIREHFRQNLDDRLGFCKTAQKPYDDVIVAALSILKYRLGDAIDVSSDGDANDWQPGVDLASIVTRCRIPNPMGRARLRVVS